MFWFIDKKCIFFQVDDGFFVNFCNLSQTDIETQRHLGTSVYSKVITRNKAAIANTNFVCAAMQSKKPYIRVLQFY